MTQYTVIGFYEDTRQRYMQQIEAESPCDAVTAALLLLEDGHDELVIVDVIAGYHTGLLDGNNLWDAVDCNWEDEETICCGLCGKTEIEQDAIDGDWIPSYWIGDTCVDVPVCDVCTKERIRQIDGEYVLIGDKE